MEPMTGVADSLANDRLAGIHRKGGVTPMTAADIILIFIEVIGLLIAFGSFVIALLAFLDRDKDHKRKK